MKQASLVLTVTMTVFILMALCTINDIHRLLRTNLVFDDHTNTNSEQSAFNQSMNPIGGSETELSKALKKSSYLLYLKALDANGIKDEKIRSIDYYLNHSNREETQFQNKSDLNK